MNQLASNKTYWIVPTYHRVRAVAFAYAFIFCALHVLDRDLEPWVWPLLVLQFLVYPHLVYWRALKAPDPQKAEFDNLLLDMALWGLWAAALGFPHWITLTLFMGSAINNGISRGHGGLLRAVLVFGATAGLGVLLFGYAQAPTESSWVTWLCALGISAYLMTIGQIAYRRTEGLRRLREKLRLSEEELLQANANLLARLNDIQTLQSQLQAHANSDPLSGLYNRRYLESTFDREQARCRREGKPLTLMMLDIDHFKVINDRYGHLIGDDVVRQVGSLMQACSRKEDVPCRFTSEEFVLLMPNISPEKALERGEQMRTEFEGIAVPLDLGEVRATVSIGIAALPEHLINLEELIRRAQRALAAAKRRGRNGVLVYSEALADEPAKP